MHSDRLFTLIANELPKIVSQLESGDVVLRSAALMRLRDFAEMTAPWRSGLSRRTSRRAVVRAVGATFAAMSMPRDDD